MAARQKRKIKSKVNSILKSLPPAGFGNLVPPLYHNCLVVIVVSTTPQRMNATHQNRKCLASYALKVLLARIPAIFTYAPKKCKSIENTTTWPVFDSAYTLYRAFAPGLRALSKPRQ